MSRREAFTDDEILQAIRAAANRCGEPLSHGRYDSVSRDVAGPSSARVIQRFGSWRQACAAAGVTAGVPARDYTTRWDRASVTSAVAAYLASEGCPGTYAGYQEWARASTDRPSGATVRNVLGGWSAAKAAGAQR
jgi:Homing endonuclease associated repeat